MYNEDAKTPASSSSKRWTRPPQNWMIKNALGRSLFGDSSSRSGASSNRESLTKSKGRLFNSHAAVHVSENAAHKSGSNLEDVSEERSHSAAVAPSSSTVSKSSRSGLQQNSAAMPTSINRIGQLRESVVSALKKTRVGQLSYDKSPDNYKSVLSPPRSSGETASTASTLYLIHPPMRSELAGASPNGAVVVDKTSGLVRFSKPAPPKETASKSEDDVRMQQWRKGMVSIQLENEREKKALVEQMTIDMENKLTIHQQGFTHKSSPTKVYGLTGDFDDTASEGDESQENESSKVMRLDLSPIPKLLPTSFSPQAEKRSAPSVNERLATPNSDTANLPNMAATSSRAFFTPITLPSAPLSTVERVARPPSPAPAPAPARMRNRASASLFPAPTAAVSATATPSPVKDSSATLQPHTLSSHTTSVAADSLKDVSSPSPASPSPQPTTINVNGRLCAEMMAACQKLRESVSLVENESVRTMQMDALAQIERKLSANPDMNTLGKLAETLAKLSTTINNLGHIKSPLPAAPAPTSASARMSFERVAELQQPATNISTANVPSNAASSSVPSERVDSAEAGVAERPVVPSVHGDRFAEYTTYLQFVEAETREFGDIKRVDIFRAELKRTIKDKINVMSKKMATRQEVKATFDFLHRLLSGQSVADHQGTPLCLRGKHVATQWTITFIIDTYLALVNADPSIVFVAAAVLAGLMLESAAFRRLFVAKLARASTLLNLDATKCASEAMQVTLKGADAKNAWMSRECALVRLFVAVHTTHDAPNDRGRPLPDGPPTLWRLFADLLNLPPAPIASATVMHELITMAGWLLNDIYGQQFRKLFHCAKTQLLPKFDRSQTRLGEAAAVVTLEITLSKGIPKKPEGFYGFSL